MYSFNKLCIDLILPIHIFYFLRNGTNRQTKKNKESRELKKRELDEVKKKTSWKKGERKRREMYRNAKERQETKEGIRSCFRYTMTFCSCAWCHSLWVFLRTLKCLTTRSQHWTQLNCTSRVASRYQVTTPNSRFRSDLTFRFLCLHSVVNRSDRTSEFCKGVFCLHTLKLMQR